MRLSLTGPYPLGLDERRAAALLLLGACVLALVMALISGHQANPDEIFHVRAAEYYLTHWLPPKIGAPDTLGSYSVYGHSYLISPDAAYFFAGVFGRLASPLVGNPLIAFRLFNVLLLVVLAAALLRAQSWPDILVGLLISPQVWYVFSYFSNDAFALFLSLVLCHQLAAPGSAFNRFLDGERGRRELGGLLAAGLCAGLLLVTKLNYLLVLGFATMYLVLREYGLVAAIAIAGVGAVLVERNVVQLGGISDPARLGLLSLGLAGLGWGIWRAAVLRPGAVSRAARLAAAGGVALAIAVPVFVYDRAINGDALQRTKTAKAVAAQTASGEFKAAEQGRRETFSGVKLRSQGVSYREIFLPPWNWAIWSALSAAGIYGYMNIVGPIPYYVAIFLVYLLFLVHLGYRVGTTLIERKWWNELPYVALFVGTVGAIVGAASYSAWIWDFQPQGRYLFPVLPVLGVMIARYRPLLDPRAVPGLVVAAYSLSVISFVFVGLWRIPKVF